MNGVGLWGAFSQHNAKDPFPIADDPLMLPKLHRGVGNSHFGSRIQQTGVYGLPHKDLKWEQEQGKADKKWGDGHDSMGFIL